VARQNSPVGGDLGEVWIGAEERVCEAKRGERNQQIPSSDWQEAFRGEFGLSRVIDYLLGLMYLMQQFISVAKYI